ncbi:MAG TPA: undecaprenyl-phosphate glucose phosphotransferase, partial [Clostridiales bacterium]|nr:undecaprenyl-phosphate glucose phosphotransferase [Clostridiales bacterium]
MIKDNQKTLNRLVLVVDALIIVLSYFISYQLRFNSFLTKLKLFSITNIKYYTFLRYAGYLWYLIPSYILIYYFYNLYSPKRGKFKAVNVFTIIKANTLGIIVFTFLLYFNKESDFARLFIFI